MDAAATSGLASLGLPLRERRSVWFAALALLSYYTATLARDLSLYDSGELALAAVQLGLGHPPGQPLHTLLGHALTYLPFIPQLAAVALASALPAALTVVPAASLAQALVSPASLPRPAALVMPWLLAAAGVHAALWEPATRIEVYALSSFFAVWAFARLAQPTGARQTPAHVLHAGLALGLCASANPMIALCAGIALAPALLLRIARRELAPRALPYAVLGGVIGLLPYAYVLAVAHRDDVMVWGAPRDSASLWHYFALRDYLREDTGLARWWAHFAAWWPWAAQQTLLPLLALGFTGWLWLGRNTGIGRASPSVLLLLLVSVIAYNFHFHLDVPDYNGYVASALWLLAAAAAAACARAFGQRPVASAVLACALALSALIGQPHVLERTRHRDQLARALGERVLREAPDGAILIARDDHYAGTFLYLQQAERRRPDAVVLIYGLANSRWHWQELYRDHPALAPFALRGQGGRAGRVRRFVERQPERAVLVEDHALAAELGLRACPGGLYLRTGAACDRRAAPDPQVPALLARTLAQLGQGSPGAHGAIADVSYTLGESLWLLGEPRAAYRVLLSGVPKAMQPRSASSTSELARAPALPNRFPGWLRGAALGDPARNLFLAGALLDAAGDGEAALAHVRAAAEDGLPEAQALLARRP